MRKSNRINPGFLCPICLVRFPYSEKLSSHWKTFHVNRKGRIRSYPSVQYAARQYLELTRGSRNGYQHNKKLPELKIFHNFKICSINVHIPQVCKFCEDIIWNCAKYCTDCGYICHVECQHLVTKHCQKMTMYQETRSLGEISQMSPIGEMRPKETSTPIPSPMSSPTRTRDDHSELDLTYITERLIAMSFPANGLESIYRTSLLGVLKMLQKKHSKNYKIINVSERRYDIMQLNDPGHVVDYGWPDHLAPTLDKLHKIIGDIHSWLHCDHKNVAVIHCKGGISRIGIVIACYVQFSKNVPSPQGALDWFALRRYYDTRLEGSLQPSQKRYVEYFGYIFEKKLKIINRILNFQNLIIHGIPYYGNGGGFCFYLKIYQSYVLKHTTKTYCIPSDSERYCVALDEDVTLQGDIMIKCFKKDLLSQSPIFRLQFHTDAIDGCVGVFGKYDLDEAFKDPGFPDSSYIEFVFSPIDEYERIKEQGIFDLERKMTTQAHPYHVPGPVNGNPYAQIDSDLKERLRSRPSQQNYNSQNLSQGIEDLDNLLGDLGFSTTSPDINANTHVRITSSNSTPKQTKNKRLNNRPSVGEIKYAPKVLERRASVEQHGRLHQAPSISYRPSASSSSTSDDVFKESPSTNSINDLLFELDQSPLNSSNGRVIGKPRSSKTNMSSYDNDESISGSDIDTSEEKNDSVDGPVEGVMIIQAGTVAQHVESLSKVLLREDNIYNQMGVPLAGLASPKLVEEKVTALNSRSLAKGYCSPPVDAVYTGQRGPAKIEHETNHHQFNGDQHEGGTLFTYGSPTYSHMHHHDNHKNYHDNNKSYEDHQKSSSGVLMRTDSAYGESMSSSSSVVSPTSLQNNTNEHHILPTDTSKQLHINASIHLTDDQDENYSPRSENNQAKSSGIGSRTSSMTSLEYEDESPGYAKIDDIKIIQRTDPIICFEELLTVDERKPKPKPSLSVVEEKVQSISIQREVEFLNNDIFKNLLEDDQKSVDSIRVISRIPIETQCNSTEIPMEREEKYKNELKMQTAHQKVELNNNNIQNGVQTITDPRNNEIKENYKNHNIQPIQINYEDNKIKVQPKQIIQNEEDLTTALAFKHLESMHHPQADIPVLEPPTNNSNIAYRHGIKITNGIIPAEDESYILSNGSFPVSNTLPNGSVNHHYNTLPGNKFKARHSPPKSTSSINSADSYTSENSFEFPSPSDGVHVVETRQRTLSRGSSTNSDDQNSPRSPKSIRNGNLTLKTRRTRGSGSSNSSISSSEIFHEVARYPSIKFDKDTMGLWYKPKLTREEATQLLKDKEPGAFVVRDSQSYDGAFGLAVKVETPPIGVLQQVGGDITKIDLDSELVRHFLIEPSKKGVRLKGSNNEPAFPSLVALIYQHTLTKMALPVPLVIPEPDTDASRKSNLTESQLLQKGAACNLVYLGTFDVESLTGDGAVHYAMNKATSQNNLHLKTTVINIKVNQQGITLTDNQRKLFFRRHYTMRDVLHCGVDPKSRKINLKPIVEVDKEVGCFGFVVRKQTNSLENECHLCAELDADQPASAVINFIHKAMRYALHA